MKTKVIEWKMDYKFTIVIQLVNALALVILGITYLFKKEILPFLLGAAILFLLLGAFNNYKYYKRKYMTIFYIVASLMLVFELVKGFL